jgi:hypothetical protein
VDSPVIWLSLCVLFLAPFVDLRNPGRVLHLDLLVLLSFGGYPVIAGGAPGGVPLAYPALAYVLARLLWVAARPVRRLEPLVPHLRIRWLAAGLVVLVGARIGINLHEAYVIDTGRSGLVGAQRILDGDALYAAGPHHDTYGPLNYLAYLPFSAVFGSDPFATDPAAAHAAAIFFDLLVIGGLLALGPRIAGGVAGRRLGVIMAYAWTAYPYSLFVLAKNTNDALLAALIVLALLALASPGRRGAALGLGAAMKFAALPLAPLFATEPGRRIRRPAVGFAVAFAVVLVVSFAPFVPDGGLREIYQRTLGFQFGSETEFGVWRLRPPLIQTALQLGALALAVGVAFLPRRRDATQVAALAGAVLVAVQLAAQHWYYFYVVWFAPMAFVALFAGYRVGAPEPTSGPALAVEGTASSETSTNGSAQGRYAHVQ